MRWCCQHCQTADLWPPKIVFTIQGFLVVEYILSSFCLWLLSFALEGILLDGPVVIIGQFSAFNCLAICCIMIVIVMKLAEFWFFTKGWIALHLRLPSHVFLPIEICSQLWMRNHQRIRLLPYLWHYLVVGIVAPQRFNHQGFIPPQTNLIMGFASLHMKLWILHYASVSCYSPKRLLSSHIPLIIRVILF